MSRFLAIGEAMVELAPAGDDPTLYRRGFAGDTMNTAWYARRCLPPEWSVDYLTCTGTDDLSRQLTGFLEAAGIGTGPVRTIPQRSIGAYMVSLTKGERSFTYWRDHSAARMLADDPAHLAQWIGGAAMVYLSGITCAILSPKGRDTLAGALVRHRRDGGALAFDPNIRPRLWDSAETMRAQITRFAALASHVLPSFDDEAACFGDPTPETTAARYLHNGADEVVVKNAGGPMVLALAGQPACTLPSGPRQEAVDSTGAGDSFNAGYLARRLCQTSPTQAAQAAHRLAAAVIGHRGALMPQEAADALWRKEAGGL